jgi:hypothetical protein
MDSSQRYTAARFSNAKPRYHKKSLLPVSYAVGSAIVAFCIWPVSGADIAPKFNASTVSTFTSKVSNRTPKENRLTGISFQERWNAVQVPTAESNGKKNEREPRAGGPIEKLPFSCELAFSRLVKTGNFSTRCISGIDSSKRAT